MSTNGFAIALFTLFLLVGSPGPSGAVELACEDTLIEVIAEDAALAARICQAISRARANLENCGLTQTHQVSVIVDPEPPFPGLLGHFLPASNEIHVMDMAQLDAALHPDSIYRLIPFHELLESIAIHEVTHSVFFRTPCGRDSCLPIHEYVASVMQIQSLPDLSRQVLSAAARVPNELQFEDFTQTFWNRSPELFAMSAWVHFSRPGRGCGFIRDLLAGEVPISSEFE